MRTLITLIILFVYLTGYSQTKPTDTIDVNKPDIEFLELLTLKKINEFKVENKRKISVVGKTVKRLSKSHSDYMLKNLVIEHTSNFILRQNKIDVECCHFGVGYVTRSTYDEIATETVNAWKISKKGHRELILDEFEYAYVGISVKPDLEHPEFFNCAVTYQSSSFD